MTFGVKTNERPGTRAQLRYARFSAFKAREVLDLIRNRPVGEARDILAFTERGSAAPIMKLLDSAVANAGNNDGISPDELYVSACFADEGPTLRRFRPRARGRASRIRKRTCHVTIIVSRYSNAELETMRDRLARSAGASASSREARARRVARSRQRVGATAAAAEELETDELETDAEITHDVADAAAETDAGQADVVEADDAAAAETTDEAPADATENDDTENDDAAAAGKDED